MNDIKCCENCKYYDGKNECLLWTLCDENLSGWDGFSCLSKWTKAKEAKK